jgi:ankyrin repeat protein
MSIRRLSAVVATAALASMGAASAATTPQLLQALKAGDHATALTLAADRAQATAAEADGTTALHWAVRQADVDVVERLLKSGADVRAANRYGVTAMHLAAENGNPKILERLIASGGDPNETGIEGETPLLTAARSGHVDAVKTLLTHGATVDAREMWHGQTALMWAAAQGHPDVMRELIAHGADVNATSNVEQWERQITSEPRDKWLPPGGLTPLLFAARENCVACIKELVAAKADVDKTTPDGISAAVMALINGHYDAAGALIEAGIDPNLADYTGRTALYAAIDFNTMVSSNRPAPKVLENKLSALDVARMLLDRGAEPNPRLKRLPPYRAKLDRGNDTMLGAGTTPFLRAAKAGDVPAMKLLLEHGADPVLAPTRSGITPLMAAAGLGSQEQDTTGRYKTQAQAIDAIQLLLDHDIDVNATAADGRTALHGAALQGYDDVIKFLASKGALLDLQDKNGFTPLDTALGRAGGFGFSGKEGVVREGTAAVLRELLGATGAPASAAGGETAAN